MQSTNSESGSPYLAVSHVMSLSNVIVKIYGLNSG